jgi:hypothetical protein
LSVVFLYTCKVVALRISFLHRDVSNKSYPRYIVMVKRVWVAKIMHRAIFMKKVVNHHSSPLSSNHGCPSCHHVRAMWLHMTPLRHSFVVPFGEDEMRCGFPTPQCSHIWQGETRRPLDLAARISMVARSDYLSSATVLLLPIGCGSGWDLPRA